MAGIGFELRKIIKKESLLSLAKMYGYSAILSSGPWVISIIAILVVGFINILTFGSDEVTRFQIIVTYAFALAASLMITGFIQLPFTRYVADTLFREESEKVLGSYFGTIAVISFFECILLAPALPLLLPDHPAIQYIFILGTFIVLSAIWIANSLVSSLKYYHEVVLAYLISYALIVFIAYLYGDNLTNLLFIFFAGNALLLFVLTYFIAKAYKPKKLIYFEFFKWKHFYFSLGLAGLFYNIGTWADKFIFWYHPMTGRSVIGAIHASVVYDLPIFIAYLSILPGMAIFFFRLEADFAEKYELFYEHIRTNGTLGIILEYRNEMVRVIRRSIHEIILVQAIIDIFLFLMGPRLFALLHIPQLYLGLFYILTVGALLQLGFMSVLALLYYLDRRRPAMWLSLLFLLLNATLSLLSIELGPSYYGYGYALSLLIAFSLSLLVIRSTMERLEYETFMHQ